MGLPSNTLSPAIALSDLRFRWRTALPDTLNIEQFSVGAGERVFIQGASGSGKSTLLGLLAGVHMPTAGSVRLLGTAIHQLGSAARDRFRADHIGFIFQLFNLIPYLSVLENVVLPCRFSVKRRQYLMDKGVLPLAEARRLLGELGLDDPALLARPVTELSVGQQQRVAAARALIGAPEIIVADEPTSALDTDSRAAFIRLLLDECQASQATLLFVSHDQQLAAAFDRSVTLEKLNQLALTTARVA